MQQQSETVSPERALAKRGPVKPDEPQETVPCPLCGGSDSRHRFYSQDILYGLPGDYALVECVRCGLNYVNPRPTIQALGRHYPEDYFASRPPEKAPVLLRPFVRAIVTGQAMSRIGAVERALGRLAPGTKIVDVGCGLNELVRQAIRLRKCEGIGVEFNPKVVEYVRDVRRLPIVKGTLEDARFDDGAFDLLTMIEYLEHEPNPKDVLREARRVVRTGGHIAIEIPYIDGLPGRTFGPRWGALDLPRHLVFYSKKTLEQMLSETGFRLIHLRTFGIPLSIGVTFASLIGCRRLNRMSSLGGLLMGLSALPFVPFTALLPEFLFAVARAE
jgi:SAM-dependent methyltransferase